MFAALDPSFRWDDDGDGCCWAVLRHSRNLRPALATFALACPNVTPAYALLQSRHNRVTSISHSDDKPGQFEHGCRQYLSDE
jgi:hypothetical protein